MNLLVDAGMFTDRGGWIFDSQFEAEMGAPYLLAHGLGVPVADARTTVTLTTPGTYHVWVRTKDWVPSHHPGRFTVTVGGHTFDHEFGATGRGWGWEDAGSIDLAAGESEIVLHDLTGFDGRCDAIVLSLDDAPPPDGAGPEARQWRRQQRGHSPQARAAGEFDVLVVGGGVTGSTATLAAARLALRVALIQNRPVLGGNASAEIGISPRGENSALVRELSARHPDGDLVARDVLDAEPNVTVFTEH